MKLQHQALVALKTANAANRQYTFGERAMADQLVNTLRLEALKLAGVGAPDKKVRPDEQVADGDPPDLIEAKQLRVLFRRQGLVEIGEHLKELLPDLEQREICRGVLLAAANDYRSLPSHKRSKLPHMAEIEARQVKDLDTRKLAVRMASIEEMHKEINRQLAVNNVQAAMIEDLRARVLSLENSAGEHALNFVNHVQACDESIAAVNARCDVLETRVQSGDKPQTEE